MVELTESKIIELMREEWSKKMLQLERSLSIFMHTPEGEKCLLGKGTKVKHAASGLLYTIVSVKPGADEVELQAPGDGKFSVSSDKFTGDHPEYELY